jgi:arsenate reductase
MNANKPRTRVLFVCVHNTARSQMAEAFLNALAGDRFRAESAGLEPGTLNPLAVEVMKEAGLDISRNATRSVFDLYKSGALFKYVIAVCDSEAARRCPVFPGLAQTLLWNFPDPASFSGTEDERLARTREVRDAIRAKVEAFIADEDKGVAPTIDVFLKTGKTGKA